MRKRSTRTALPAATARALAALLGAVAAGLKWVDAGFPGVEAGAVQGDMARIPATST